MTNRKNDRDEAQAEPQEASKQFGTLLLLLRAGALYRMNLASKLCDEIDNAPDLAELREETNLVNILANYSNRSEAFVNLVEERWPHVMAEPYNRPRQLEAAMDFEDAFAAALRSLSLWEQLLPPLKMPFLEGVRHRDSWCMETLRRWKDDKFFADLDSAA